MERVVRHIYWVLVFFATLANAQTGTQPTQTIKKPQSIGNIKHGEYIVELQPGYSMYKQVTAPQVGAFGAKDLNNANFSLGYSFLTSPFLMVAEPHKHDFDQYLFFLGGDPDNIVGFPDGHPKSPTCGHFKIPHLAAQISR